MGIKKISMILMVIMAKFNLGYANPVCLEKARTTYVIKKGDRLDEVLIKYNYSNIYEANGSLNELLVTNNFSEQQIDHPPVGQKIFLPYRCTKVKTFEKIKSSKNILTKKSITTSVTNDNEPEKSIFNFSGFYLFSLGQYEEQSKSQSLTQSASQNAPLALGIAIGAKLDEKQQISGSAYLSKISYTSSSGKDYDLTEFGGNVYYVRKLKNFNLSAGQDWERLNTFNLTSNPALFNIRTNDIFYLTVGIDKPYQYKKHRLFFKASASKSVLSSSSIANAEFEGYKFMLYAMYFLKNGYFINGLMKYHMLESNQTNLTILRAGVGFGKSF